jgi:NTP pyrophosphatase (non-canonical NTP hydrolase)
MKLDEIQKLIDDWINTYGIRYFDEMTNMVLLTEEVGELARLVAREYGEQSFKNIEDRTRIKDKIADEMADIFFVLTCLANQMDIDLTEAVRKNIEKKTNRDKERHLKNDKLN